MLQVQSFYTQQLGDKKDLPRVQCIKCGRTGNLTTKKTKSHGTTYEYYYIQHYIKETDKIEWCYLGKYDRLPQDYKDKLEQNAVHKESSYIQDYTQTSKDSKKAKTGLKSQKKGGGVRVWSKETGLGPVGEGLRGFKPHPPHHLEPISRSRARS